MVAFVEDVAGGDGVVVQAAPDGLRHHQGVVGHHQLGTSRASNGVFDEALLPVLAAGVDAFAAAVGEAGGVGGAEQVGEPAGQVAALDVAVIGGHGPARDQAERDDGWMAPWMAPWIAPWAAAGQDRSQGVLEVQQAEVVFPAFAHHHAAAAFGGVGDQPGHLAFDLALQVAGEGADPDGPLVAFGPQAGGGDVAEGLAGAGAGLGQDEVRVAALFARGEGVGDGGGVVGLARSGFCAVSEDGGQAGSGLVRGDAEGGGGRGWGQFLPFWQALPHPQRFVRRYCIGQAEGGEHRLGPAPAAFSHAGCEFG